MENLDENKANEAAEEILKHALTFTDPSATDDRKKYEEVLRKIIVDKMPLKDALGFTPELLEVMYGQAYTLYNAGKYSDAIPLFSLIANLEPMNYKYMMGVAACLHKLGEYDDAIQAYKACYFLDVKNPLPSFHMADCLIKSKEPWMAIYCLTVSIMQAEQNSRFSVIKERALLLQQHLLDEVGYSPETARFKE